ncbi:MAG: SpoIVB peptidase S55 domain-containing protein, partial [Candidatus Bipolaricaulis sp.]|nr:SpoIVB peptidase S55 domain-containing protein [Candidatus Bipolaricaulis sp.]
MRRAAWIVGWMLIAATVSTAAYDRAEFLFLDEVRIGMKGIGKTVVSSDTISEFDVEILGVIDQPGTLSDFIVVRVSGEAIGRSGGIAQGMSGSPIYVDGRLIGALSRAATWSKEITPIGLVTPIEPMLAVLDSVRTPSAVGADPSAVLDGVT